MSKNILDLSPGNRRKIIREVVLQPRTFKGEVLRVILAIIVVSIITWSFSLADDIIDLVNGSDEVTVENYSVIGLISKIDDGYIKLAEADTSDGKKDISKKYYVADAETIESSEYQPLTLEDLEVGNKVILQGHLINSKEVTIHRIISFGFHVPAEPTTATSTATTTIDVASSTPTTTIDIEEGTSTDDGDDSEGGSSGGSTDTSTTTPETNNSTTTPEVDNGTTTPEVSSGTTTDDGNDTSTTTPEIVEPDTSTTTPEVDNSTTTDDGDENEPTTPEVTEPDTSTTTPESSDPEPTLEPEPEPTQEPEPESDPESEPEPTPEPEENNEVV